jgi:hypothetical protein
MVRLTFALLPSPLLGSEAWGPVAEVLRSGGWSVLEQAGAAEPPGGRRAEAVPRGTADGPGPRAGAP